MPVWHLKPQARTSDELVRDAEHAARLLNDELLQGTLDEIEEEYLDGFVAADEPTDTRLYWQLHAVDDLRRILRAKLDRGTVEAERAR